MTKLAKNTICLWYDGDGEDAARFYAKTFPNSSVGAVHRAPGDFPSGKQGDVLTVEFNAMGIPCLGLNGGPAFKHNQAFSFQVATASAHRLPVRVSVPANVGSPDVHRESRHQALLRMSPGRASRSYTSRLPAARRGGPLCGCEGIDDERPVCARGRQC